jgi:branched-chain amino acid transport system substrate-binding protein
MRQQRKLARVAVTAATFALIAAACGSSKSAGSGTATTAKGAETTKPADVTTTSAKAPDTSAKPAETTKPALADPEGQKGAGAIKAIEDAAKAKPLAATGDPVVIGFQNPEGDPNGSFPEYTLAAQAAVDYINKELGGIGSKDGKPGRPIKLEVCKMAITPADSQKCANEIAAKKPFAVISSLNFFGNHFDIYKQANIPVIVGTPITALDFTSPGVYAIGGGGGCLGVHTGLISFAAQELKKTNIAVPWANTPPGVFCYHDLEKKPLEVLAGKKLDGSDRKADGNDLKGSIPTLKHIGVSVKPGQADVTPEATQVLESKPEAIIFSAQGADCWTLVSTLDKLGWKQSTTPLVLSGACIDLAKMKELGDITKGIYFVGGVNILDPSGLEGQLKEEATTYNAKMKQYSNDETRTKGFATAGFTAIMQVWEIAQEASGGDPTKVSGAEFSKAMGATAGHHQWASTGLDCVGGAKNAPYIAVCNSTVTATQWDGTTLKTVKKNYSGLGLVKGTELDFGK